MKAYKIEILVIDNEEMGEDSIRYYVGNCRYVHPLVMKVQSADIGEWDDDHPLNKSETIDEAYKSYFAESKS